MMNENEFSAILNSMAEIKQEMEGMNRRLSFMEDKLFHKEELNPFS
jgi:K+/H+ antiporter YhaU regulatory subunit KhtT